MVTFAFPRAMPPRRRRAKIHTHAPTGPAKTAPTLPNATGLPSTRRCPGGVWKRRRCPDRHEPVERRDDAAEPEHVDGYLGVERVMEWSHGSVVGWAKRSVPTNATAAGSRL